MSFPPVLKKFLEDKGIAYEFLHHPANPSSLKAASDLGLDPDRVARASLVRDARGILMVIYPISSRLNLEELNRRLKRKLSILNAKGVYVPVSAVYKVNAIVDDSLLGNAPVHMVLDEETFCRVSGADFQALQGTAIWVNSVFIRAANQKSAQVIDLGRMSTSQLLVEDVDARRKRIRMRLDNVDKLPAMPKIAQEILQLGSNPYANTTDLAAIIEQDPSLSAQLLRYARSPFYGYRGEVSSVQDAISRVLGFDMVMDMALGIAIGKAFRNPVEGRLGLQAFWKHSTYCAALTQKLANSCSQHPRPGMAYLAGLLHNFGFLLLGHLFPDEFSLLNKAMEKHPETPILELEENVLGVTHMEIGSWLMQAWNLPDELVITAQEHHNEEYHSFHAVFPNLVLLSNRLLTSFNMGDESSEDIPGHLLKSLGLSMDKVMDIFNAVIENKEGLDYMAVQMAA